MRSNAQVVVIEYPQIIYSPVFAVGEFSELFGYPPLFFLLEGLILAKIMYDILFDLIYVKF